MRRLRFWTLGTWILLALLGAALVSAPSRAEESAAAAPEGRRHQAIAREARYLKELAGKIRSEHLHGADHSEGELASKGARFLAKAASDPKSAEPLEKVTLQNLGMLAQAFKDAEFSGVDDLFAALSDYVLYYSGATQAEFGAVTEALIDVVGLGMVKALDDPFSALMNEEQFAEFQKQMNDIANDKSIGASLRKDEEAGVVKVAHVRWGTVGYYAGLKADDVVTAINGRDPLEIPKKEVREMLQMEPGVEFSLTIRREGLDEPLTLELTQRRNPRQTVYAEMLPGRIGYLRTTMFLPALTRECDEALRDLEARGMQALVLDLRNNPGGSMQDCLNVANFFLESGRVITSVETTAPNFFTPRNRVYRARARRTHPPYPVAVLINKMSASASEMLSGALRENDRALIIGTQSFGKGIGQSVSPLTSKMGRRFLYLTTLEYRLPRGTDIHHVGVPVDIEVEDFSVSPRDFQALTMLRNEGLLQTAVHGLFDRDPTGFRALADYRAPVPASQLAAIKRALGPLRATFDRDETLAQALRQEARFELEDRAGRLIHADLAYDPPLKRAWTAMSAKLDGTEAAGDENPEDF